MGRHRSRRFAAPRLYQRAQRSGDWDSALDQTNFARPLSVAVRAEAFILSACDGRRTAISVVASR